MSLPTEKSSTHDSGSMEIYRNVSNNLAEEISQDQLSDIPSEVSLVFELPSEDTNVHISVNPSIRKMTTKCYQNGSRTILRARCERPRKSYIRSSSREISGQPSIRSPDYDSPTSRATPDCADNLSMPALDGSYQRVLSRCNPPSASNSIPLTAHSYNQSPSDTNSKHYTYYIAQKITPDHSTRSVLNVNNSKNDATHASEMNERSIESKRWAADTPEVVEAVTSYTQAAPSDHSHLLGKLTEMRPPSSNKIYRQATYLLQEAPANLQEELADVAIAEDKYSNNETEPSASNEVCFKNSTSNRRAKCTLNVAKGRKRTATKLAKEFSKEMGCIELSGASSYSPKGVQSKRSTAIGNVDSEQSKHARTEDEIRQQVCVSIANSENYASTSSTEKDMQVSKTSNKHKSTKSRRRRSKTSECSLKSNEIDESKKHSRMFKWFKAYFYGMRRHHGHKISDENIKKMLQKSFNGFVELANRNSRLSAECVKNDLRDLSRSDNELLDSRTSLLSITETYTIGSNTSCATRDSLPTTSETTDNDCFADESDLYRPLDYDNRRRKKKSPLYSETQSNAFAADARNVDAGSSRIAAPVTTEGDAYSNRRQPIDRGVRIGHTSMNYFLSWDTDDFVQQEHMYNSTGVGVQDEGHKSTSTRGRGRTMKKYRKRRQEFEDDRDVDLDADSRFISDAGAFGNYGGFVCEKESALQEEFISHDIDDSRSNEYDDSVHYVSPRQSFEENTSSNDFHRYVDISNSSTVLYTLFSNTKISEDVIPSDTAASQDREVKLIFSNSHKTSLENDSLSGLLTNHGIESPKKLSRENVSATPSPELCASDDTQIIKRKKHRLSEQARRYLLKYDEASTASEECMSVDQFDVSNSSIILRRKRKKPTDGMTFLAVRKTHPCRNLPRLMLKQDVKQSNSMCSASESSESQLTKEISLENVKDYSKRCCDYTSSSTKHSYPKWVKSLDNLIDFSYILPKITRLGNDEEIFSKKGTKIAKKLSKSTTALVVNSDDRKRQAVIEDSHKTVGQDVSSTSRKGVQKPTMMSKLQAFRAERKKKYSIVKVDTSSTIPPVDSNVLQANRSQQARASSEGVSKFSKSPQQSKEICANIKKLVGTTAGTESASNNARNKRTQAKRGKGKARMFLRCVTAETNDSDNIINSNRARTANPCNQDTDKTVILRRKPAEIEDDKTTRDSFTKGKSKVGQSRRKELVENEDENRSNDCTSSRKTDVTETRKVVENPVSNSAECCAPSREAVAENAKIPMVKKIADKVKRNQIIIGAGRAADAVDSRRKTDRRTTKKPVTIEYFGSSKRDGKVETIELSDDDWVTDDTASVVSEKGTKGAMQIDFPSGGNAGPVVVVRQRDSRQNDARCSRDAGAKDVIETEVSVKSSKDQRNENRAAVVKTITQRTDIGKSRKNQVDGVECKNNNQEDIAKSTKNRESFVKDTKNLAEDVLRRNVSGNRNSFVRNSNDESKGSGSKCPSPSSLKSSSTCQPDSSKRDSKQSAIVKTSSNQVESANRNATRSAEVTENVRQVDSIKSNRSPAASLFKSVQKPKKVVKNRTPAAAPVLEEVQTRPKSALKEEDRAPIKPANARLRAAEYDRRIVLISKTRRELQLQKQENAMAKHENKPSPECERYLNTGQTILAQRGT